MKSKILCQGSFLYSLGCPAADTRNFKDLLINLGGVLTSFKKLSGCEMIIINSKIKHEDLKEFDKARIIVNTRSLISLKNKNKLKYIELW